MAAPQSRNLAFVAVALVALAAVMVWVLITPPGESEDATEPEEVSPPAAATPAEPAASAQMPSEPPAAPAAPVERGDGVDFFAGEMPDFMTDAHLRVIDKKWLGAPMQKQLYQFGQDNKDDARPQLLLAWDSMNREWDGYAVRLYRMAYRADPRAKQEPTMLRDLLDIAARHDRVEFRETVGIVKEAFGEEALPAIEDKLAALGKAGNQQGVERLERLRDKLTEP